jgi:arylsulfatase A-like enzyme
VFPTALAAAGLPLPTGTQGEPLPTVHHPTLAEDDVNAYLVAQYGAIYDRALRVLVELPYKLIATSRGEHLLFNLAADPTEGQNLVETEPRQAEAMAERLGALLPFGLEPARPTR